MAVEVSSYDKLKALDLSFAFAMMLAMIAIALKSVAWLLSSTWTEKRRMV